MSRNRVRNKGRKFHADKGRGNSVYKSGRDKYIIQTYKIGFKIK